MVQPLSPAFIFTQFYDTPLPEKNVILLEKWNRSHVLKLLISLKLALQPKVDEKQHRLVSILIGFLLSRRPSRFGAIEESTLTNKTVILQIISDVLAMNETNSLGNQTGRNEFFQDVLDTILIYNEYQFSTTNIAEPNEKLSRFDVWRIGLMQELNAENPTTYRRIGAVKQLIYLKFLKKHFGDEYHKFEQGVLQHTELPSLVNVALLFLNFQNECDQAVKQLRPAVVVEPNDNRSKLLHNLELVIDASSSGTKATAAELCTKPFLKLNDGRLYFLGTADFDLISTKSWDHYLVKNNLFQKVLPGVQNSNQLRGQWGKPYVESFLGLGIFRSLEKTGVRVIPSDDRNRADVTMIINEKDVFIIEIKSSALHFNVTSSKDIEGFQQFIDQNFAINNKGVPQLNRSIKHLSGHAKAAYSLKTPIKKLRIYPIIIYMESHLTKHAVNDYVITNAPSLPNNLQDSFQHIEDVTLIHMDFFIDNIRLIREDRSLLRKAITEYHRFVKTKKSTYDKKGFPLDYFAAMASFETWVNRKFGIYQDSAQKIFKTLCEIFDIDNNSF